MKFIAGLLFIALSVTGIAADADEMREENADYYNNPHNFCKLRPAGRYCWDKAMEIIRCPDGRIERLDEGRFCPLLGRVPKDYHGEKAFDVHKFCEGKSGLHCPPEGTDSLGIWQCPEGLQLPCGLGKVCKQHGKHCMCVDTQKPPVGECRTKVHTEDKDRREEKTVTEISCKGETCATYITAESHKSTHTNYVCTKTKGCCTTPTTRVTVTVSDCSIVAQHKETVTKTVHGAASSASSGSDSDLPASAGSSSSCTCPGTSCCCSNLIVTTVTVWNNQTCTTVDPKCTTTKTVTESQVCKAYATYCIYNPRFDALAEKDLDWAVRPVCESVVVCEKWGWSGCERLPNQEAVERVAEGANDMEEKGEVEAEAEDEEPVAQDLKN